MQITVLPREFGKTVAHAANSGSRSSRSRSNTAPNKYALVISICYEHDQRLRLEGCDNDADNFTSALVGVYGYDEQNIRTIRGAQATGAAIVRGVQWLVQCSRNGATECVLFYAGHGTPGKPNPDEPSGRDQCLVAADNQYVSDNTIARLLSKTAPTCTTVCVFDCCHSGSMIDAPSLGSKPVPSSGGPCVCVAACSDTSYAYEKNNAGVFTTLMVSQMRRKDGRVKTRALHQQKLPRQRIEVSHVGTLPELLFSVP